MFVKRLASASDFDQVYAIYMDNTVLPFLGYDRMSKPQFRPVFEELIGSRAFFVYEQHGEVAGFFKAARHPGRCNHVAYVGTLAVKPSYQGRGLGMQMMQELISEVRDGGVKRVELIVESDNLRGITFYKRLGFEIEGTLRKFYKRAGEDRYIDDHVMGLLLEELP